MLQKQLTYNAVRNRIKKTCLSHKLIKGVYFNRYSDLTEDKNVNYPSVFIQAKGGTIAQGRHSSTVDFRMLVLDRTFLSADTTDNESDVISDCIGIAQDIIAQLNYIGNFNNDSVFSLTSNYEILIDKNSDVTAGIYFDFTITILFYQNVCAAPSDIPINEDDMKEVYDADWTAPLDILDDTFAFPVPDEVKGKKVLHVVRANYPLFRTQTETIQSNEYKFDGIIMIFGTPIQPGERTLILYRQY